MNITILTSSNERVTAPAEKWLCGIIAVLTDEQKASLMRLVATRVELGGPVGHVISVPGISTGERFGRLGGKS